VFVSLCVSIFSLIAVIVYSFVGKSMITLQLIRVLVIFVCLYYL